MPRKPVKTIPIKKDQFMAILKATGHTIRELGVEKTITASDKTLRRQLNNNRMREKYIEEIARYINVDPSLITKTHITEYHIAHISDFPYSRKELNDLRKEQIKETLSRILAIFYKSYSQFETLTYEERYSFQKDLFEAIYPVIRLHFPSDSKSKPTFISEEWIFEELDSAFEEYNTRTYADTQLRRKYLSNIPSGYTKKQIETMSPEEIIFLDQCMHTENEKIKACVKLTDNGIQMYKKTKTDRPQILKTDDYKENDHCYCFMSSEDQLFHYFLQFGNDAEIIYPTTLKERIELYISYGIEEDNN